MLISFDLDGTICNSDWGWLDMLRDKNWPSDEEEKYYACREKVLDPYMFMSADDEAIILTGRPIHLKNITEKWLKKNGLGQLELIFTETLQGYPNGKVDEFKALGEAKAKFFIDRKIKVHFDDNEEIVKIMRETLPNIIVIYTGWHTTW
jgi:phosphoglycolate phosphatase-like HAD superfamily hydrolase